MKSLQIIALTSFLLIGCRPELPSLENFDFEKWTNDKKGCKGERALLIKSLKNQKTALLERTQNEIQELLGEPDEHELYERSRKYFYYYLEPSKYCQDSITGKTRILQIRFSAMGISNEVFVKNE